VDLGLADVVQRHAQQRGGDIALHFEGQNFSYGQLWRCIESAARALKDAGVQPGERVACLSLNHTGVIVLLFALARLGAILLPLNYRLATAELAAVLSHADAGLVVADSTYRTLANELANQLAGGPGMAVLPLDALTAVDSPGYASTAAHGITDLPVLLVYTSGTTGQPKGALHTQAGLLANCQIAIQAQELTADDHVLTVLPLFHVGGLCIQTLPALYAGAQVSLHARFDAATWLADVQRLRPTTSLMVPATMRAVIDHADFAQTDLSSLRQLSAGSSSIPTALINAFHARAIPVCQVYGATETGPVSICLAPADAPARVGSAGRAAAGVEVRLVDESGAEVAAHKVGEICLRAPNLMREYWRDPDNPAFQNGWFHTGDLAFCDHDGFYHVVGRSKDMIISGGENIYPAEIENILAECAWIDEATVIGLPDDKWGEVAVAVIVKKPDSPHDESDLMAMFDGRLARYKQPRRVVFCESLPKTALGKVQKPQLAAQVMHGLGE
jgi:fatty-acyl-CoA synthase